MTAEESGSQPGHTPDRPDLDRIVKITGDELPAEVQEARRDPSRLFGKYVLLNLLGRGGTGYVRKAWDTMLGRHVALKFISRQTGGKEATPGGPAVETEQIRDLLQEARLAARLRHPHIVSVHDVGYVASRFYIAMEFIDGKNLIDHMAAARERGWPSPLYADPVFYLGMLCDVVGAIDYAHTFSPPIIHCDLKPSNVMVRSDGAAFVLDFGLARAADPSSSEDVGVRGTPGYMAPEQVSGQASGLGVWTDIYGLGALLYALLTGRPPITGDLPGVLQLIARKTPERPSTLLRDNPEYAEQIRNHAIMPYLARIEEMCMRCLAKRPEDRYRLASRLEADLRSILDDLRGVRQEAAERRKARAGPVDMTASQQLLLKDVDPRRVAELLNDRIKRASFMESFRARLAAKLNERHPVVLEYPRQDGTTDSLRILKVTPARIYMLSRGEVEVGNWTGLPAYQLTALAEAAGASEPDDRLALGLLKLGAGSAETPGAADEGRPASPPEDAPLELL